MSRFRVAPRAAADLRHIRKRIAEDNPPRAASYLEELSEHFRRLAEMPLIGRSRPELGRNLRSIPHDDYVIFYRPSSEGIEVVRVRHGRQNISQGIQ